MADKIATEVLEEFKNLTFSEWDAKIKYRGIDFKYDYRLQEAAECYEQKIPICEKEVPRLDIEVAIGKIAPELFMEPELPPDDSQLVYVRAKLERLKEKYACVLKEQEFRAQGLVEREMHGTTYYIDLDNGDDGNDGLSKDNPWLTIEQYTTVTVRSAGDIAKVRANTSEIPVGTIGFDESGTVDSYIEIRGCSSTDDPWGDASDVKPIIDFNDVLNRYMYFIDDYYWRLYRLDIKQVNYVNGGLYIRRLRGLLFEDCDIHDCSSTGARMDLAASYVWFKGCTLYGNVGTGVSGGFNLRFTSCDFYGGVATQDYGISADGPVYLEDCTFGTIDSDPHDVASINSYSGFVYCRNCKFDDPADVEFYAQAGGGYLLSEDHDQVAGAQVCQSILGKVSRDSVIQLDSLDSAKMAPTAICGLNYPMTLSPNYSVVGNYQIWCPAALTTITIKARETAAWAADPTSSEFYFEASYLDGVSGQSRSVQASSQSLNGTNEISFTMTFTPNAAGWVYVTCYLKKYEAGKSVNASVKPVVS